MPETKRRKIVQRYELLDDSEYGLAPLLDALACLYSMPIAFVAIVNENELTIRAKYGTDLVSMPRETAFCNQVIFIIRSFKILP